MKHSFTNCPVCDELITVVDIYFSKGENKKITNIQCKNEYHYYEEFDDNDIIYQTIYFGNICLCWDETTENDYMVFTAEFAGNGYLKKLSKKIMTIQIKSFKNLKSKLEKLMVFA